MQRKCEVDTNNVEIDEYFGYVHIIDFNKKDIDFCETEYRGITYKCRYLDGCFNPFILPVENKATIVFKPY